MPDISLFTIGFTKKSAERFFTLLRDAGVRRVLDVRLNNSSQLAGFAKQDDLRFFLREIAGIEYVYLTELTPTQEIIDTGRKRKDWAAFEEKYRRLIEDRKIENAVDRSLLDMGCLLCSEDRPDHCHRRIAAEYLAEKLGNIAITHLY
ncbi:MAG: DUF488 domain-containing protein [Gemmatimonadota bacterium]|jgi:uncharacterized protein (DUF488 family)